MQKLSCVLPNNDITLYLEAGKFKCFQHIKCCYYTEVFYSVALYIKYAPNSVHSMNSVLADLRFLTANILSVFEG